MKNTQFSTYQVKGRCEIKLSINFRKGKEFSGWYMNNDRKIKRITIPKGRKKIGKGLYRSMANQLNLDVGEFDKLLVCPLKKDGYEDILRAKGLI